MTKSKAKTINSDNTAKTTKLAVTAMLAALSAVLMFFEFPLGFIAPSFYEFDFSEVPVLVGTFSMGPIAGAVIEFVKILVKFLIKGTSTGGVGELANFLIGCLQKIQEQYGVQAALQLPQERRYSSFQAKSFEFF